MSNQASGASTGNNGGGKITLTLWVHDASQASASQQTSSAQNAAPTYGVPLANTLSSEILLSPELLKNELLNVQVGDVVELVKASLPSNAGGSNALNTHAGSHEKLYKHHHRSHRKRSGRDTPKELPNTEALVFRVEQSSLASEGNSGQLQVRLNLPVSRYIRMTSEFAMV